jgi:hypothetical protein
MSNRIQRLVACTASLLLIATGAWAQQYAYPAKGQSPDQQKKDESDCSTWAKNQSGFDPSKPPPAAAPTQPTTATGTTPGAGVRGAARGAVVGGIAGDAGAGAAAGAAAGRAQSRRSNASQQQQANAQVSQAQAAGYDAYAKARAACLEGKGYTVK